MDALDNFSIPVVKTFHVLSSKMFVRFNTTSKIACFGDQGNVRNKKY